MDKKIDKINSFHKKFGFYLQNLILIKNDKLNNIEYYSNYNKIDVYKYDVYKYDVYKYDVNKYDVNNTSEVGEWTFIPNYAKEL